MSSRVDRGAEPQSVVKLRIAYDGTAFFGSQRQGNERTVQGELERAAEEIYKRRVPIYLAGRTDRGVHAVGQVATYADPRPSMANSVVQSAFNAQLPMDVSVGACERKEIGFHARYSAKSREYRYRVWSGVRQPLAEPFVWRIRSALDLEAMNRVAERFIGEHDFASFASGGTGVPNAGQKAAGKGTVRTVMECFCSSVPNWWGAPRDEGELVEIRVVANGFLPKMVRGIVGALVEVGRANWSENDVYRLLVARDRRKGPMNAPARGLTLWSVEYDKT